MKIWQMTFPQSLVDYYSYMYGTDAAGHQRLGQSNISDIYHHRSSIPDSHPSAAFSTRDEELIKTGPMEIMRIDDPNFALDYFELRNGYASARLRSVFALQPSEVFYRPIDTSNCFEAARAQDYQIFLALKSANPFDTARMPGHVEPVRQVDGSFRHEWVLERPKFHPGNPHFPLHFRPDFVPPAPIFRLAGFRGRLMATEELADRVTRARMTGIAFRDIEGERKPGEPSEFRVPGIDVPDIPVPARAAKPARAPASKRVRRSKVDPSLDADDAAARKILGLD